MENRKQNIVNALGRALFIVLFLFLISGFSSGLAHKTSLQGYVSAAAEFHANSPKAVIIAILEVPSVHVINKDGLNKLLLPFFNKNLRFAVEGRIVSQRINSLQQICLDFKPDDYSRFYYHFFSNNSDFPLILS